MDATTRHHLHFDDSSSMSDVDAAAVDLVVTSPPYPMIAMWDEAFAAEDADVRGALAAEDGERAFEAMHRRLDFVWSECFRVLRPGGVMCVNVGDATRKIGGEFRMFPNHARILDVARRTGFSVLPDILWRKPNNSPNKFLGSGMLPAGAYVTYEHEYVLILRKGPPRVFGTEAERRRRRASAFFQEERNVWFSDIWTDLRGASQVLAARDVRARSAAFPFELAWRLVQMYSLVGDTVLDPFLGTGTTAVAAAASGRSSIGYERDPALRETVLAALGEAPRIGVERARRRLTDHAVFIASREASGKAPRHRNEFYDFGVVTSQERELRLVAATSVEVCGPTRIECGAAVVDSIGGVVGGRAEMTGESREGA